MRQIIFALAVIALMFNVESASAGDHSEANRLFVEAVKLFNAAEDKKSAVGRLDALEGALAKFYEILDEHSSSDLAAKLISAQDQGGVSLEQVSDAAVRARILYYEGGNIPENYAEQFVRIFNVVGEIESD